MGDIWDMSALQRNHRVNNEILRRVRKERKERKGGENKETKREKGGLKKGIEEPSTFFKLGSAVQSFSFCPTTLLTYHNINIIIDFNNSLWKLKYEKKQTHFLPLCLRTVDA